MPRGLDHRISAQKAKTAGSIDRGYEGDENVHRKKSNLPDATPDPSHSKRPAKNRTGKAAICSTTEKRTRTRIDLSYNNPMAALPRNQATPKPGSNTPNAV